MFTNDEMANGITGILTFSDWIRMPNGEEYKACWGTWIFLTDKQMPIPEFHSGERWTAWALEDGKPVVIIPGCRVVGLAVQPVSPQQAYIYHVGATRSWQG